MSSPIPPTEGLNKTEDKVRESLLFLSAFDLGHCFSPNFGLKLALEVVPSALLGLQLADSACRSWDLSVPIII